MLFVTFETIEDEETAILAEKSTILDGRRRRRQENVELIPSQPPVGVGARAGGWARQYVFVAKFVTNQVNNCAIVDTSGLSSALSYYILFIYLVFVLNYIIFLYSSKYNNIYLVENSQS